MSEPQSRPERRGRSTRRRERALSQETATGGSRWMPAPGGRFAPLNDAETAEIYAAALVLLERLGLSGAPDGMVRRVTAEGGRLDDDGRLLFPSSLVERAVAGLQGDVDLFSRRDGYDLRLGGNRVHTGTGGGAPQIRDIDTGTYRNTTVQDLFDIGRIVDRQEHIHFFSRSVVGTDATGPLSLDINTAYACLASTSKHVCVSIMEPENVPPVAALCYEVAGGEQAFRNAPFLTVMATHVVPPMRFATESCEIVEQAVLYGLPVQLISAGQMGATSPVTLAGSLVQAVAESLAGITFAWLVDPGGSIIFAPKPLVSDLRTGAMCGGGGEQAVLMAAAAQMGRHLDLPVSCIAGYSDSKLHDAQAGYEKNLSVALAAHAGCNMITHACGTLASMLGCSLESFVIDNDMLGGVLRSLHGLEVTPETIASDVIADVVRGPGHFLGHPQTLERMESDYVYPVMADRQSPAAWQEDGARDILDRAADQVREILAEPPARHLDPDFDRWVRARHDILLPEFPA